MEDLAYLMACEDARDDWHWFGIIRTDEQVEKEAERYRKLEKNKKEGVKCN